MNLLLALTVVLSAVGQLLTKAGADRTLPDSDALKNVSPFAAVRRFLRKAANPFLICGLVVVAAVPFLYTRALASLSLTKAYGATGLTYPLVIFGSAVILRERISLRHIAGGLLIFAGFLVWNVFP
jgi:drug/metabolite transporter (DMT)-like permease